MSSDCCLIFLVLLCFTSQIKNIYFYRMWWSSFVFIIRNSWEINGEMNQCFTLLIVVHNIWQEGSCSTVHCLSSSEMTALVNGTKTERRARNVSRNWVWIYLISFNKPLTLLTGKTGDSSLVLMKMLEENKSWRMFIWQNVAWINYWELISLHILCDFQMP